MSSAAESLIRKHPLQRLSSPSAGVSAFVHFIGLSSFAASFKYLVDYPSPVNTSYGWHFQYLTIIGLSLATVTFAFGSLADITKSPRLFLIKNALSVCSAPLEILISILYWSLRTIDKNLVMPEWAQLDPWAGTSIPISLDRMHHPGEMNQLNDFPDVGFHAVPALMLSIDLLFLSPPWTITALPAMGVSSILAFSYWFWVELCYQHNGWYPYPIFEILTPAWRAALFAGSALVMTLSTATLKWLYGRVNGYGVGTAPRARPGAVKE